MKTTIKNLGSTFFLTLLGFGLNASESGLYTANNEAVESPLEVETWMLESDYFNANIAEMENFLMLDDETSFELEDWMFEANHFEVNSLLENMLLVEDELALDIEKWMTDENYFDAGVPEFYEMVLVDMEPSLELEEWMMEEKRFGTGETEFTYNLGTVAEPDLDLEAWMIDMEFFGIELSNSSESTVVDIALSNPDFSILVDAVSKAGLVEALSAEGPFTVFAPSNEAFQKLFSDLGISGIRDLTAEQLKPILTYHVVSGKFMASDLTNSKIKTLNDGKKIKIDTSNGVKINDSKVVKADISGNNGVVHVLDKVLIPN